MGKVMGKLVFFAVLMLVLPIATMFLAQKYLFDGQDFTLDFTVNFTVDVIL